jgi:hypothetical protein
MDTYTATGIAEGFIDAQDDAEVIEAWQTLIDTGLAWQLQGWFGRQAQHMIDEGYCLTAEESRLLKAATALGKIQFVRVGD